MEAPIRTCSEICIDADNNPTDIKHLSALWKEVMRNKKSYPLSELYFISEHLMAYSKKEAERSAEEIKQLLRASPIGNDFKDLLGLIL